MKRDIIDGEVMRRYYSQLPETIKQITHIIGCEKTAKIVTALGGCRFSFVKGIKQSSLFRYNQICEIVGETNAAKLASEFNGEELYIPNCTNLKTLQRNQKLITDYQQYICLGDTPSNAKIKLCIKYQLSNVHVKNIINKNLN